MRNTRPHRRRGAVEVPRIAFFAVPLTLASFFVGIALFSTWTMRDRKSRRQRRLHTEPSQTHSRSKAQQTAGRLAAPQDALLATLSNGHSHTAGNRSPDASSPVTRAVRDVRAAKGAPASLKPDPAESFIVEINRQRESDAAARVVKQKATGQNGLSTGSAPSSASPATARAAEAPAIPVATETAAVAVIPAAAETAGSAAATAIMAEPVTEPGHNEAATLARRRVVHQIYARPIRSRWKRLLSLVAVIAVVVTLVVSARAAAAYIGMDTTLTVRVDNQQPVTIDPRSSSPRSPYVYGMNVFPAEGTQALDGSFGFVPYDAKTIAGLTGAGVTMLRFPGGTWGEEHTVSFAQLGALLTLAQKTHATPLVQVRLQGGSATQAAAMVSYTNRADDANRKSTPNVPFLPVRYWVIGNEPDLVGPNYTVRDYVNDFIAYATAMKAVDPTIQIYGPELSEVNGTSAPLDSTGTPWLTGFLTGIAAYEQAHHTKILDGVSFHSYMFGSHTSSFSLMLSSANSWSYTISQIRQETQEIMGENLPIAVTEINVNIHGNTNLLSTALWWADNLGALQEEQVSIVDFFAARGLPLEDMLLTLSGRPTPLYFVMQLYTHMASNVIQVGGTAGPVSVYAATSSSHDTISLMFINKSPNIAAAAIEPGQTFSSWHSARVNVPPYTIVCVVLHRDAPGQSFTYGPTPSMLAHGDMGRIVSQSLP